MYQITVYSIGQKSYPGISEMNWLFSALGWVSGCCGTAPLGVQKALCVAVRVCKAGPRIAEVLQRSFTPLIFTLRPFLLADLSFGFCPETVNLFFSFQSHLLRKIAIEKQFCGWTHKILDPLYFSLISA